MTHLVINMHLFISCITVTSTIKCLLNTNAHDSDRLLPGHTVYIIYMEFSNKKKSVFTVYQGRGQSKSDNSIGLIARCFWDLMGGALE